MNINEKLDQGMALDKFECEAQGLLSHLGIEPPYDLKQFGTAVYRLQLLYNEAKDKIKRSKDFHAGEHRKFYQEVIKQQRAILRYKHQSERLRQTIRVWKQELVDRGIWDEFCSAVKSRHPKKDGVLAGMREDQSSSDGLSLPH